MILKPKLYNGISNENNEIQYNINNSNNENIRENEENQ